MPEDEYEVRRVGREETEGFLEAEQARRRRRRPGLEEIEPAQVPARLDASGARGRLAGVRVTATAYSWRWPWATLEHVDVVDCDLEGIEIKPRLLRASRLDDCRFENVAMGGANIGGTAFTGCVFEGFGLAGTARGSVRNSTFRGCTFARLDARGIQFDASSSRTARSTGCADRSRSSIAARSSGPGSGAGSGRSSSTAAASTTST